MAPNDDNTVEIADPEGFTGNKRLKQIYRAREDLRKTRKKAAQARNQPNAGARTKIKAVQAYRAGVESYLLEVGTLLRQHAPELWRDRHYGTVVIRPPGNWERRFGHFAAKDLEVEPNVPMKVKNIPDAKEVPIVGLRWLFETETPVTRSFEFELVSSRVNETVTKTGSAAIGWQTLNKMVTDINAFLNEVGIGLDTDEGSEWTI